MSTCIGSTGDSCGFLSKLLVRLAIIREFGANSEGFSLKLSCEVFTAQLEEEIANKEDKQGSEDDRDGMDVGTLSTRLL